MKKLLSMFLAVSLLLALPASLAGCAQETTPPAESRYETSPVAQPDAPGTKETLPETQETAPETQETAPETQETAPETSADVTVTDTPDTEKETAADPGTLENPDGMIFDPITLPERVKPFAQGSEVVVLSTGLIGSGIEHQIWAGVSALLDPSVVERDEEVKKLLNVTVFTKSLDQNDPMSVSNYIRKMLMAGEDDYQITVSPFNYMVNDTLKGGYLDLTGIEELHTELLYWSQGINEAAAWGEGHQFVATGLITPSLYRYMQAVVYDREAIPADSRLPDPYDCVKSGGWTLEAMDEYAAELAQSNASGKEIKGFAAGTYAIVDSFWQAADAAWIKKDQANLPVFDPDMDKLNRMVEYLITFLSGRTYTTVAKDKITDDAIRTETERLFKQKGCFMTVMPLRFLESDMKDFSDRLGLLPLPKFSADQASYRTPVTDSVMGYAIPSTVRDGAMTGAVLDCLAYSSLNTVRTAYLKAVLPAPYAGGDRSAMTELLYRTSSMDLSEVYSGSIGAMMSDMRDLVSSGTFAFNKKISYFKASTERNLNKLLSRFERLNEICDPPAAVG